MPGKGCRKRGRKHTPITSKAQRGLFGAELSRRRRGLKRRMKRITTAELRSHLRESGGKRLPARASARTRRSRNGRRRPRRRAR